MKILHVCANYYPAKGGPQYTMKHISEKLVEFYGDEVEVATTNSYYGPESKLFSKIANAKEIINGVKVRRYSFRRWHYSLIRFAAKACYKITKKAIPLSLAKRRWGLDAPAIKRAIDNSSAQVIMATTIIYNFAEYPLNRFTLKRPKPFVLYGAVHLAKHIHVPDYLFERARKADCYIANTEFEKKILIEKDVQADKIIVAGTGIELNEFVRNSEEVKLYKNKLKIDERQLVIGFVGRLVKGKGLDVLIEAFKLLLKQQNDITLLIAGGHTDYSATLKDEIRRNKLPVILLENFDDDEKPDIYHAMDIFVLPSASESFGVVFLEAWACKKPVIGANVGAVASLISEGKDGLLFEAHDSTSLCKTLLTLINNPVLRLTAGKTGYQKIIDLYTWPVVVKKYRDAYLLAIENFEKDYSKRLAYQHS